MKKLILNPAKFVFNCVCGGWTLSDFDINPRPAILKPLLNHMIHFLLMWGVCTFLTVGGYVFMFFIKRFTGWKGFGRRGKKDVLDVDPLKSAIDASVNKAIETAFQTKLPSAMEKAVESNVRMLLGLFVDDSVATPIVSVNNIVFRRALESSLDAKLRRSFGTVLSNSLDARIHKSIRSSMQRSLRPALHTTFRSSLRVPLTLALKGKLGTAIRSELQTQLVPALSAALPGALDTRINTALDDLLVPALKTTLPTALDTPLAAAVDSAVDSHLQPALNASLDWRLVPALESALNAKLSPLQEAGLDMLGGRTMFGALCHAASSLATASSPPEAPVTEPTTTQTAANDPESATASQSYSTPKL